MLSLVLLASIASTSPSTSCERLCLATVQSVGVDVDERMVLEAALVRALDAPRCSDPVTIDDACFSDDECVRKTATHPFVVVRAVHAGSELRVTWAAVHPSSIVRGSDVTEAQKFYANGLLDRNIAQGPCTPTPTNATNATNASTTPSTTTTTTTTTTTNATTTTITPAMIAIGAGLAVAAVSMAAFALSASTIEDASSDGKAKETAFVVGWASIGGVVVGVAAAVVGIVMSTQ